jgi:hypothetical protein
LFGSASPRRVKEELDEGGKEFVALIPYHLLVPAREAQQSAHFTRLDY